jgi:aldehyde:ferredoxin oxidoreductase
MGGYAGSILYVDLTSGNIEARPLDLEFAKKYIGGLGFGTKIYLDLIKGKPDFDPLSPDNPFVLMTGPLTGMRTNAVARWTVGSKSPLTGLWGDCNIGGFFGAQLKFAGYDGIVITGAAKGPAYISIEDAKVEIRDAQKYWGRDVYTVNDEMIADHKTTSKKSGQVFAIGPAGENLVKFASIINDKGHVAGRTGLGAVWGAKKLKAIFVRGTGKLEVEHPDRFDDLRKELKELYDGNITTEGLRAFGTASHMDIGSISGDVPMKNWQEGDWELFDEIGPIAYEEKILTGNNTCYACGVACKREAEVKEGAFKFAKGPGPEYETIAAFGTLCLNASIKSIGKANDICNRYGMDTITCGATIAFAIECFENGLINEKDTDGLKLTWGNAEAIVAMVEKIGKREGIGSILSEGSAKAAEQIGGSASDFLTTVKGLEAPMHDPRAAHSYGLAYAVSSRGACHVASLVYPVEGLGMYLPEIPELADELTGMSSEGKAKLNIAYQDYGIFFSHCAGFCSLGAAILNATQAVDMVNHVTGFDYTLDEVMRLGRRIWYIKRGLSNLFGAKAEHDVLPKRLMTILDTGPTEGSIPDMDLMLREFYNLRGLNEEGVPEKKVLEELGLTELATLLYDRHS